MTRVWLGKTHVIHRLAFWLAVGITGTLMVLSWIGVTPLVRLENDLLDLRFKLRGERQPGREIFVVAAEVRALLPAASKMGPQAEEQASLCQVPVRDESPPSLG